MMGKEQKQEQKKYYAGSDEVNVAADPVVKYMDEKALEKNIAKIRKSMEKAAKELDFVQAARYRDEMFELEKLLKEKKGTNP
jgi:excinuclease ABC subunit B